MPADFIAALKIKIKPYISRNIKRIYWESKDLVKYTFPAVLRPRVPLSKRGKDWLNELRTKGIVKIQTPELLEVANYTDTNYFDKISQLKNHNLTSEQLGQEGLFAFENNHDAERKVGVTVLCEISFKDRHFEKLFLNPEITALLYNYYRRQPYYRNQPVIQRVDYKESLKDTDIFHVDHLHQISGMLLISDQSENDTHMEYVVGNHKRDLLKEGIYPSKEQIEKVAAKGPIYRCTGPKGTLFIFDTTAVHRRRLKQGTTRKVLHFNVNTGHHMFGFKENFKNWPTLENQSNYIQRMFEGNKFAVDPSSLKKF